MEEEDIEGSLSFRFRHGLTKWRLVFLVFLFFYATFLVWNLGSTPIQWDESNHLDGGLVLLHGRFDLFMELSRFYPPLDDLMISGYFAVLGASVFTGRLVSVTFSLLSIWVLFEFVYKFYNPRTALLTGVIFGLMPGFVWLSRLAMLESMLVFFFMASMMLFYVWLRNRKDRFLFLGGISLGLGFLAKYQIVVAVLAMALSMVFLCRRSLSVVFKKYTLMILLAILVIFPWVLISYDAYSSGMLNQWLYAMNIGNPDKTLYSSRFQPIPIFYLIEMVWPYGAIHPISVFVYIWSLLGLGFLLWRRQQADKFLLVWFFVVYAFFTSIGNREWRYMVPVFPVLAFSASNMMVSSLSRLKKWGKLSEHNLNRQVILKMSIILLSIFIIVGLFFSVNDSCVWLRKTEEMKIPVSEAVDFLNNDLARNESVLVLCPLNVFSQDIVRFYLYADGARSNRVWQYPELPVDTYEPSFKINELNKICSERNVKYLLLYEYGEDYPYFQSNLTMRIVSENLESSEGYILSTEIGSYPCRMFVYSRIPT